MTKILSLVRWCYRVEHDKLVTLNHYLETYILQRDIYLTNLKQCYLSKRCNWLQYWISKIALNSFIYLSITLDIIYLYSWFWAGILIAFIISIV